MRKYMTIVITAALFFAFIGAALAQEVCLVETPSGEVAVIHPNWNRYTVTNEAGKKQIDLDEFCLAETMKQPGLIGRQPFHDMQEPGMNEALQGPSKWLERNPGHPLAVKLRAAKAVADSMKRQRIEMSALPERISHRRGAWRIKLEASGKLVVFDDQAITTNLEVKDAIAWKEEQIISTSGAALSVLERKLLFGKPWLLTQGELNAIVDDWRQGLPQGHKSKFIPPADRRPARIPSRPN